jgi:glucosamine-6-phosphate deaminase
MIRAFQIDSLQVQVHENRTQAGRAAAVAVARRMRELLDRRESVRMVFAAAPSQNEFLDALAELTADLDWRRVEAFQMDEYIGLPPDAPQRFSAYLKSRIWNIVRPGRVHIMNPDAGDAEPECARYADLLTRQPIDIVCLGIGENGHIAFNDPPVADFADAKIVKTVELDEACRRQQVNDGCFPRLADVPRTAMTMTIPALMSGKALFAIVPGARKKPAVRQTLHGPISRACPASILRRHPDCTLFVDREAYDG